MLPTSAEHEQPPEQAELGERLQIEGVGVEYLHLDRAQLVPGELVGAGAVPHQRLFVEGVDRDPPEVVPAGAGEVGEVLGGVAGNSMSELENWSQARPPKTIAAVTARTAEGGAGPLSTRGSRDSSSARRRAAARLQPPQKGEEDERERRSRRAG